MTIQITEFPFSLQQELSWGDMDALNHINNVNYFRYFENARLKYFESIGVIEEMEKTKVGPILGATECKYLLPLTYPDTISVGVIVSQIREKRLTMQYAIYSQKLEKIAAEGSAEIIFVDFAIGRSTLISETILAAIKHLQGN
ncbi:MAG: acyl-CoA thioesterase [Betaproteobacteria bacterium]|nr:acyl-CoA thioesterase [Betaproteobacteria bacterium]